MKCIFSKIKTATYFVVFSIVLVIVITVSILLVIDHYLKKEALIEAREKAELILDRNLSVHEFYSKELKPSLFNALKDTINKSYFNPNWMSSTHGIIEIQRFFDKRNDFGYYYKDAAINARSAKNEADTLERRYLKKLNKLGDVPAKEGIIEFNGKSHYYLIKKGETMKKECLRCHTNPERAPNGLVKIYGDEKSFERMEGDVISAVSIRIPLSKAYERANNYLETMSLIIFGLLTIIFLFYTFIQHKLILLPIQTLHKKTYDISRNN
ncbi:MAG: DUF3365 domain-containing protein [Bacteroidales bacterium]|nr:DUF3365 domain-containing protein [Bacteroidales bacterium]